MSEFPKTNITVLCTQGIEHWIVCAHDSARLCAWGWLLSGVTVGVMRPPFRLELPCLKMENITWSTVPRWDGGRSHGCTCLFFLHVGVLSFLFCLSVLDLKRRDGGHHDSVRSHWGGGGRSQKRQNLSLYCWEGFWGDNQRQARGQAGHPGIQQ